MVVVVMVVVMVLMLMLVRLGTMMMLSILIGDSLVCSFWLEPGASATARLSMSMTGGAWDPSLAARDARAMPLDSLRAAEAPGGGQKEQKSESWC